MKVPAGLVSSEAALLGERGGGGGALAAFSLSSFCARMPLVSLSVS